MKDVEVRLARPGDGHGSAHAWLDAGRYYAELAPDLFQVPAEDGLAQWFDQAYADKVPGSLHLVATVDAQVAGLVSADLQPPLPNPERQLIRGLDRPRVFVAALAVAALHRRAGIATALMTHVERWALDHDAAMVSLDTYASSQLSVPFYETRMGYTRHSLTFRKQLS